jgi:hypothetical protein
MRASYRAGVRWIAENDEPLDMDVESIKGFISTLLLADLFHKDPMSVALAVLNERRAMREKGAS